jgi:hypothetical protein
VRDLFVNSTDLTADQMVDYIEDGGQSSTWAPQFLALFTATDTFANFDLVRGWTATSAGPDTAYYLQIQNFPVGGCCNDVASFGAPPRDAGENIRGVFLYRQVAAVPEPTSLLLFGMGIASIAAKASRKRNKAQ